MSKPSFTTDDVSSKSEPEGIVSTAKGTTVRIETLQKAAPTETNSPARPSRGPDEGGKTSTPPDLPAPTETPDASGESSVPAEPQKSLWARLSHPNVLMNLLLDSRKGLRMLMLFAAALGRGGARTDARTRQDARGSVPCRTARHLLARYHSWNRNHAHTHGGSSCLGGRLRGVRHRPQAHGSIARVDWGFPDRRPWIMAPDSSGLRAGRSFPRRRRTSPRPRS